MATPFRSRAPNAETPVYGSIAHPQPTYPNFPIALHHDNSGYDATGYESRQHRHPDAQHHVGHDKGIAPHTSPIRKHGVAAVTSSPGRSPTTDTAACFDILPPLSSTHASWQALHDYA